MGLTAAFFYLFAILMIASAVMVITAKNPVHAVLFLILTFVNAAPKGPNGHGHGPRQPKPAAGG